ncbi:BTAD domain-containing putative transcriptional regulator [Bacillus sp. 1P10SD]|uniref:BTAD domain-containing putative transcriptional regulator n=1 Tax=Bacillus sp. 1P10SD TaxID=3132265 RepID=UPI0039A66E3D
MIPSSRLQIPKNDPTFIRTTLFNGLDNHFSKPLVSVVAGGGYGKTTLIANYLRFRNITTLWFSYHELNRDFPVIIELLEKGLSLEHAQQPELSILEAVAHWDQPLAIVFDDFHFVESPALRDFLLQLVQHASEYVTFVVISRQRPSFPYTKLKVQNRLAEINEMQLEFTPTELNDYFQQQCLSLKEHELELIHIKTCGWPASLPLILEAWKEASPKNRRWDWRMFPFSDLFEELETEMFTALSEVSSFLQLSSILHEWDHQIITTFSSEIPKEWSDGRLNQRFYIRKNKDGKQTYLPLFRMYLYEKLMETQGKQKVRELHLKAAKLYEADYHYYFAFAHYLAAYNYGDAARLMQKMMNLYTPERFILLLDGTLETICPSISMALFSHFLFRSVPVPILSSYIEPIKQTLSSLKKQGVSSSLVYLEHRLGIILYYSGEIVDAKNHFISSFEGSQLIGHSDLVSVNFALAAQCCRFSGKLEEGVTLAKKALTNIEQEGASDSRMHATWVLTELLLEQNELAHAEPFVEELLRLSHQYDDEGARVYPLIAIGKYFRLKGDFEKALLFTKQGMAEAEKFNLATDLGWGCLELGLIYFEQNEPLLAEQYLQRASEFFSHYSYFSSMVNQFLEKVRPFPKEFDSTITVRPLKSSKLTIKLFGSFQLQVNGKTIALQRKSSLRLLFYLAVQSQQKIPKDILVEELFGDGNYSSQNNRFYVSLSTLRKALEPDLGAARLSKYIIQSGEFIFLDKNECEIDLERFRLLVQPVIGQSNEERIDNLKKAVELYQGDLLAEYPYESFLDPIRETTKQSYLQILKELGKHYWGQKDITQGMHYYDLIIQQDEYAEDVYWEYIRLLLENGLVSSAQQIGSKMENVIEGELGIPIKDKLQGLFSSRNKN